MTVQLEVRIKLDFSFVVGTGEEHLVHFHFNQPIGSLRIDVDDRPVIRDFRMFSIPTTVKYEFLVGGSEQHNVRIEKTRKPFMGGARKQAYRVFVDGELLREY